MAEELLTPSANVVTISEVSVKSERLGDEPYHLASLVSEIQIFENIDLPYLTGKIMISDMVAVNERINWQGGENVTISVSIPGDPSSELVTKEFVVTHVEHTVASSDTSQAFILSILEKHAYLSELICLSKAYAGKPEDIIRDILKDKLKISFEKVDELGESQQGSMRVVVPNISPLSAVRMMKDRMSNQNGLPYFIYSTLNDENLIFSNLEQMLSLPILNKKYPYRYGQAYTNYASESHNVYIQATVISDYKITNTENMFKMLKDGVVASRYDFVDTTLGDSFSSEVDYEKLTDAKVMERMVEKNIFTTEQREKIYDDVVKYDDKLLAEFNPNTYAQITTSNSYNDGYLNYFEERDANKHLQKVQNRILRKYLVKSPLHLEMPGFNFLRRTGQKNLTIGRQIRVEFLKNDQSIYNDEESRAYDTVLDEKRSGDYIIYAMQHVLRPEYYHVGMTCSKLANRNSDLQGVA